MCSPCQCFRNARHLVSKLFAEIDETGMTHNAGTFVHRELSQIVDDIDSEAVALKACLSERVWGVIESSTFWARMSGPGWIPPAVTALKRQIQCMLERLT